MEFFLKNWEPQMLKAQAFILQIISYCYKIYWAKRCHKHSGLTQRQQYLFKKQNGKCNWCNGQFTIDDLNRMEIDHIKPKSLGGTNDWSNLQILHRHCHDSKTAQDGSLKRKKSEDVVTTSSTEQNVSTDEFLW
jgi:5-methylcytosine-specific restriction endonuclease McrA